MRTAIKTKPLTKNCGWKNQERFYCWWETPAEEQAHIPSELLERVLPGLDNLALAASAAFQAFELDMSAIHFTSLLKYLRRVFLEDAVVMRSLWPQWPAYQHSVFQHPIWEIYRLAELERIVQRETLHQLTFTNSEMAAVFRAEMAASHQNFFAQVQKLTELVATTANSGLGPGSSSGLGTGLGPGLSPDLQQLLTMKDHDLHLAYQEWVEGKRDYFMDRSGRIPWHEVFQGKEGAHKQRAQKMLPWLTYVDGLVNAGWEQKKVLDEMALFAKLLKKKHSVFIKDVFYSMINQTPVQSDASILLRELMIKAGLPVEL